MLRLLMFPVYQQSEPTSHTRNNKKFGDEARVCRLTSFLHHRNNLLVLFLQFFMRKKQPLEFGGPPVMCNLSNKANNNKIFEAKTDPSQARLNSNLAGWMFKAKTDPSQARLNSNLAGWMFKAKTDPSQARLNSNLAGWIFKAKTDPSQARLNSDLGEWIFRARTDPSQAKLNPDLGDW